MKKRLGVVGLFCLFCTAGVHASSPEVHSFAGMAQSERDAEFDDLLSRRAQRTLDQLRLKGDGSFPDRAVATFHVATGKIVVDLRGGRLPSTGGAELEDMQQYMMNDVLDLARPVIPASGVEFRYNGKSFEEQYPEDAYVPPPRARDQVPAGPVVVAAGHGWYFHHGFGDWRAQRDPYNGIIEDEITPVYRDELQRWLESRSAVEVNVVRSTSEGAHAPSMQAWWRLGARYQLQESMPERVEIWNSLPHATDALRERNEDIRSRPLFANSVGAAALISLHTNGGAATATGARVFYYEGRTQDERLARSILCSMKELITSQAGYEEYAVPTLPEAGRHGENGLATMPAVIVEAGFHSNASDALALQDPLFRTAAMKGVEKGYRLFRQGKDCKPLKVEPIKAVTMKQGTTLEVDVPFAGYPRYPMKLITRNVGCPPGWTCTGTEVQVDAPQETPLKIALTCRNNGSAPLFWETSLVDDDGVTSKPVRHRQQCIRSS